MIAYFDCFSGISGDMMLGALIDAGVPLQKLSRELSRLSVKGYKLEVKKVRRAGFAASKVNVVLTAGGVRRTTHDARRIKSGVRSQKSEARKWTNVKGIIEQSSLRDDIKEKGLHVFKRLFRAEARVHGGKYTAVHLHELGAVDCIVDIFGTIIGLDMLGIEKVYASNINVGSGNIKTEHGLLPVPAPATVELLKGIPVYSTDISFELTTPTGAALISSLASGFGRVPDMEISKTGIGAGDRDFKKQANVLRLLIGKGIKGKKQSGDSVTVIETNIDDMDPRIYEYVMEQLFRAGALDVFLTNIMMKKGRPGIKLSVLCDERKREKLAEIILHETTSIGVRFYTVGRTVLDRKIKPVNTAFGKVNVKSVRLKNDKHRVSLEYEDCKKIAKKFGIPLIEVMRVIEG